MDSSTILVKTAKGADEIRHRSTELSQPLRAALIMADGTTSLSALVERTGLTGDEGIVWLVRQGYLEPAPNARAASAASPSSRPAPLAGSDISAKQALIALSRDLLGPDAAKVIQRLQESSDGVTDLAAAIDRCHKLIKLTIDEGKAERFLKLGQALLNEHR